MWEMNKVSRQIGSNQIIKIFQKLIIGGGDRLFSFLENKYIQLVKHIVSFIRKELPVYFSNRLEYSE